MPDLLFGTRPRYLLQTERRRLLADGEPLPIGSRALDVLIALLQRPGQTVSRATLVAEVWPDVVVEDNNLNVQISGLRKLLGTDAIVTVPGRGYQFTLPVAGATDTPKGPGDTPQGPADTPQAAAETRAPRPAARAGLPLPALVGRDSEIALLERALSRHRVVSLLGPGGVGKTLLARHLLQRLEARYRHGASLVELTHLGDTQALAGTVAAALGVHLRPHGDPDGPTGLESLARALAPLHMLVLLDGAEHLVEGVAALVAALHRDAPGVHLLVTSQAPLRLSYEHRHRLQPLSLPRPGPIDPAEALHHGAVALFVERAREADARFCLDAGNAADVVRLCRALEGLPLALEMAAWRAPSLGLRHLAAHAPGDLRLLALPHRDVPQRHRSLHAALTWTHGLLTPVEQTVFRRLAALPASADLERIQAVVADPPGTGPVDACQVVEALATLVERSLLTVTQPLPEVWHYRMLDAPRAFAHEHLEAAGEAEHLAARHAQVLARHFDEALEAYFAPGGHHRLWHERQRLSLTAGQAAWQWALGHGDTGLQAQLLPGLLHATPWEDAPLRHVLVRHAVALAEGLPAGRARLLLGVALAAHHLMLGHPMPGPLLAQLLDDARRGAESNGLRHWLYYARCVQATELLMADRRAEGLQALDAARALEGPDCSSYLRAQRWYAEVWRADRDGDSAALYAATVEFVRLETQAGLPEWYLRQQMINCCVADGRWTEAIEHAQATIAWVRGHRDLRALTDAHIQMLPALLALDRVDEALDAARQAWPTAAPLGREPFLADYLALIVVRQGRAAESARLLGYADRLNQARGVARALNEAAAVDQASRLTDGRLGAEEAARLRAQGRALSAEDAGRLAFGDPAAGMRAA